METAANVELVQGVSIVEQLDVSVADTAASSQCIQQSRLTIEAKLKHMHDFLSNYMPNATIEE